MDEPQFYIIKNGVLIRDRDAVEVEHFPQDLDNDLLVAFNGEFTDIHFFWQFLQ